MFNEIYAFFITFKSSKGRVSDSRCSIRKFRTFYIRGFSSPPALSELSPNENFC